MHTQCIYAVHSTYVTTYYANNTCSQVHYWHHHVKSIHSSSFAVGMLIIMYKHTQAHHGIWLSISNIEDVIICT